MSPINKENNQEFTSTMFSSPKSRRSAIKNIASGMTIAALSGCVSIRKPKKIIKTYTNEQKKLIPGIPNYYATSTEIGNEVSSLIVASHEGRPTKIDGNPNCSNTKGASSAFLQAEIQQLYDPDRLKTGLISNKPNTLNSIKKEIDKIDLSKNTIVVLNKTHSIINRSLLQKLKKQNISIYFIDPINRDKQQTVIKELTGSVGYVDYKFSNCKFLVSFSDDFLASHNSSNNIIGSFIKYQNKIDKVFFSNSPTITDSKADRIVNTSINQQENSILYLTKKIVQKIGNVDERNKVAALEYDKNLIDRSFLDKLIAKFIKLSGKSLITIGEQHSSEVQKLGLFLNSVLKNTGRTIVLRSYKRYTERFLNKTYFNESINDIKEKLDSNKIENFISFDVDITRFIPNFKDLAKDIKIVALSNYKNNLTNLSDIVIPKSHFLENWGILLSKEGHLHIQQPLLERLNKSSLSDTDLLLKLNKNRKDSYTFIRQFLKNQQIDFKRLKSDGVLKKTNRNRLVPRYSNFKINLVTKKKTLNVTPSYQMYDGRYSNNAWLNETPDPITKLTWGNAFVVNSVVANEQNLKTGDVIRLTLKNETKLKGPIVIIPGQNSNTITVNYGFGELLQGAFSGYGIKTDQLDVNTEIEINNIEKTNEVETLPDTQMNHGLDEEKLAASGIKNRIKKILQIKTQEEIDTPHHDSHHIHSLFKEQEYPAKNQWGMSIDLNSCIGCNACAVSCQAENNIPVVGKEEVIKGREMSWIRVDRYFIENDANETTINFMPVACVHCENAPCEQVCPVNATVHDDEGLNVMTYNRCIGTRYCANNCPYKVRRFNFYDWHQKNPQSQKKDRIHLFDYFKEPTKETQMQFNPEVTIRMRGVMEKCSYCLQRITNAKINAKNKNDQSYIDKLTTACQDACPTSAIMFGDINNKSSQISKNRNSKRRYDLLQTELNTKPRTIYLAKLKKNLWTTTKETSHGYH